ncbi:Uncharacterized protein TPAR_02986 [Tolypocladium paradoxum]|uniref:Uncharacterized protein n=1 Tax=Tolypocladium paradoxum TaxID=94208 RepID=A0A2S4L329_9HYPO|nr:Uncharacterized protein TPAR_02986 [Tolypocladium paradoxum]
MYDFVDPTFNIITMCGSLARFGAQLAHKPRYITLFILPILFLALYKALDDFSGDVPLLSDGRTWAAVDIDSITASAEQYRQSAIQPPYKHQFWEVGQRSRKLVEWLKYIDQIPGRSESKRKLVSAAETTATTLFPFIGSSPGKPNSKMPLNDLRSIYKKGSQGIVIPVGGGGQAVRFAAHLIVSLRDVLGCRLPIQIVYAGDTDLTKKQRDALASFDSTKNIEFLDVFTMFDDSTLSLQQGHWAIKPFAALASRFEQVILLDSDAVFLQQPEQLLKQRAYHDTGAYLFHDRLLWQHEFRERHEWWKDQIKEPSPALNRSRVWTEDYAEECDSGVVVLDKSRRQVFVGLLHIAWQNTRDVREEVSYKLTYGDKETWWLGLELAGSSYEFEPHYGSILGWEKEQPDDNGAESDRVCSFVIAHTDDNERLIWFNGSLVKNKLVDSESYEVPTAWMMDGSWEKGATKQSMSCMVGAEVRRLSGEEQRILRRSIEGASKVDSTLKEIGLGMSKDGQWVES